MARQTGINDVAAPEARACGTGSAIQVMLSGTGRAGTPASIAILWSKDTGGDANPYGARSTTMRHTYPSVCQAVGSSGCGRTAPRQAPPAGAVEEHSALAAKGRRRGGPPPI